MPCYRKLLPADLFQLTRHLLALVSDERRMRFHGSVGDLAIERYCRRIDWFRSVAVGYFVDGRLRGVAQLSFERALYPRDGELAVTVETPWQGRGVGSQLVRRAVTVARNRGVRHLSMLCLVENRRMRRIAATLEGALQFDGTTVEADLGLARATPWTWLEELVHDGAGNLTAAADSLLAPAPEA